MAPELRRWLGTALGVAVLAVVIYRLVQARGELSLSWQNVSWFFLGASFALLSASQVLFAYAWHRLLHAHAMQSGFRDDFSRWSVSLAGKYLPGKIWQGVARVGLYHRSVSKALVAQVYAREMALSISAALLLGAAPSKFLPAQGQLLCLVGATGLLLLAVSPLGPLAAKFFSRIVPFDIVSPARPSHLLGNWAAMLLAYLLLGAGFALLARSLVAIPLALTFALTSALCLAGVAGIAAVFVPAGLGVRELALVWCLSGLIGNGNAALLAIASRVWLSIGELCLVLAGLYVLRDRAKADFPSA